MLLVTGKKKTKKPNKSSKRKANKISNLQVFVKINTRNDCAINLLWPWGARVPPVPQFACL